MIFLDLFLTFFKIGLLGFGGGYGMISLIQFDVVDSRGWMTASEFADILALSQMTPGPISINCATYVGYTQAGIPGAVFASFALCLPTIIMMAAVIGWLFEHQENKYVSNVLSVLKPIVAGLIMSAAVLMMNKDNFFGWESIAVCAVTFILTYFRSVNPIYLIVVSGLFGYIYY